MPTPAKPAKLQLIQGNPAKKNVEELEKRAANEEKLKMSAENVVPPSWLDATAKKEFNRLAKLLIGIELINEADINTLALYCDALSEYLACKREIKAKGKWIDNKPSPFYLRKKDAAAQMRVLSADLGLSPSARARLAINLSTEEDDEIDI
ncbi:phage terminase small subunit P27 family [Heyndrickxia acidicola]|uniref:Phage terminase small subunit P27 family n=1 Tax=Heyndrickxia acidicola TaxID=209389 RepID=A0ABU6MMD0_9BACI|nr:phage terminase small subunit P27 family [Heyndrickxia acidicola]MED1205838.1 phage terminase small subunit P27 family [Heyndrickxia acidicola]